MRALRVPQQGNLGLGALVMIVDEPLLEGDGTLLLRGGVVGKGGRVVDGLDGGSGNHEGDVPGDDADPAEAGASELPRATMRWMPVAQGSSRT